MTPASTPTGEPPGELRLLDDPDVVRAFCVEHLGADPGPTGVTYLPGGVSSLTVRVDLGGTALVLKQALPRLRVAAVWESRRERALVEAACAQAIDALVPGAVPRVVAVVPSRFAFAMEAAPEGSVTWKARLMDGSVRPDDAARAGTLLGRIHAASAGRADLAAAFADREFFEELRVDPYLRTVAARHPDLAPAIGEVVAGLEGPGRCLVHGDYSPKNLLVTPDDGLLLIDHEVGHWGHPAFDVAFVVSHLCLKAVWRGRDGAPYLGLARGLLDAYRAVPGVDPEASGAASGRLLAGLLLARVDGKSPVEYLTDERDRDLVRAVARRGLTGSLAGPEDVIAHVARRIAS